MRHHRLIAAVAALCLVPASGAADDTIFDFVAPRADQVGNYQAGTGAVVTGGFGTLAPIAGWFDDTWAYRLALTIDNPGSPLTEWQLGLVIDADTNAGYDIFAFGQPTGADLRLVDTSGAPLGLISLGRWSLEDNIGRLWFQMATIAAGQTLLDVYFGNPTAPAIDDPDGVFSYSAPYASRYALEPNAANSLLLVSASNANDYDVGGLMGTLQAGDLFPVPSGSWAEGEPIAADAPFDIGWFTDAATGAAPVAFARTLHSVVVNRGAENQFRMVAPFAHSTVTVDGNGVTVDTVTLTVGVSGIHASDTPNDAIVTFTATTPIMVSHRSSDPWDGHILPPPASEVWGFRSGTPRVHAVGGATDITVYSSNQTVTTASIAAGGFVALTAGGSGTGDALRIVAVDAATQLPAPITVIANGDGDGGDSIAFHPEAELGRRWVVPTSGTFVLIAATRPSTTCTLSPPMAADVIVTSLPTEVPPFPARIKFGADTGNNIAAGSVITCDNPGFAYYEDFALDDERNLFPDEAHRKTNATPPALTLTDNLVTRYAISAGAVIDTPDAVAPTAVTAWTDFRVAAQQPANTDIAYQLSIDDGNTYLVPFNGTWIEAQDMTVGVTEDGIRDNLAMLDTDTGRVRIRAILRTTDGVARPAIDSIRVFYDAAGAANRLVWDPMPATVIAGTGFDVGFEAVDTDGNRITGLGGLVTITSSHSGAVIPATVDLVNGRAAFNIKLLGTGDDVVLRADGPSALVGLSAAFDLVAPDGATPIRERHRSVRAGGFHPGRSARRARGRRGRRSDRRCTGDVRGHGGRRSAHARRGTIYRGDHRR